MTNLKEEVKLQQARWSELDTLMRIAKELSPEDDEYRSICRSITVLICSHFEGAVKGISKAILRDMNERITFDRFPSNMRNKYVRVAVLAYTHENSKGKEELRSIEGLDDLDVMHISSMLCRGRHEVEMDRLLT